MTKSTNGRRLLDQYPTETGVTRVLLDHVNIGGWVCEPCAGGGMMADVLEGQLLVSRVWTNDIDQGCPTDFHGDAALPDAAVWRYRDPDIQHAWQLPYDWVVTNPPFNQAIDILRHAWEHAAVGVAFLLRLSFLEPAGRASGDRGRWLVEHEDQMTHLITLGQPRPSFTGNGRTDSVTTAWMVWQKNWSWERLGMERLGIERPFRFAMKWRHK